MTVAGGVATERDRERQQQFARSRNGVRGQSGLDCGAIADGLLSHGGQLPEKVKMRRISTVTGGDAFLANCIMLSLLLGISCGRPTNQDVATPRPSAASILEEQQWQQFIRLTNGTTVFSTPSDVALGHGEDWAVVVGFDTNTMALLNITLRKRENGDDRIKIIVDANADGIPDVKEVMGDTRRHVFYRGEWHVSERRGAHWIITVDGQEVLVHFDGSRWVMLNEPN
jgi:hypothetical protein